mmetsp:Transcript_20172/g.30924  ORF Transcript_20172/g.30924 Transcript_20172/m.30924 type:complete len:182 (+) Transcript_20172:1121-1666(+)
MLLSWSNTPKKKQHSTQRKKKLGRPSKSSSLLPPNSNAGVTSSSSSSSSSMRRRSLSPSNMRRNRGHHHHGNDPTTTNKSSNGGNNVAAQHVRSHSDPEVSSIFTTLLNPEDRPEGYIGAYSPEARKQRITKFLQKRKHRVWTKKVKYDVRKNFADSRLRVKGRFVKKEDELLMRDLIGLT